MWGSSIATFKDLQNWLDGLPDQRRVPTVIERTSTTTFVGPICETGETYVEFHEVALARPADVDVIEKMVAERMYRSLAMYFSDRKGRIYWRVPFETDIAEAPVVLRYDVDGADTDIMTDQKCVMDRNWRKVACYCRLFRAKETAAEAA